MSSSLPASIACKEIEHASSKTDDTKSIDHKWPITKNHETFGAVLDILTTNTPYTWNLNGMLIDVLSEIDSYVQSINPGASLTC